MLKPLLSLVIYTFTSILISEHNLRLPNSFPEYHASLSYLHILSSRSSHYRLSTTISSTSTVTPIIQATTGNSDFGHVGIMHIEQDPITKKSMYTRPTMIYIFDCNECGGASHIKSETLTIDRRHSECVLYRCKCPIHGCVLLDNVRKLTFHF
jgi:hypothetical protein